MSKSKTTAPTGRIAKPRTSAKAKAQQVAGWEVAARDDAAIVSLASTIRLPYRPTSFKLKDLRRVVADLKRTQG